MLSTGDRYVIARESNVVQETLAVSLIRRRRAFLGLMVSA
jgi:hypothetical protein